jgi:hypothetical protein
MLTYRGQIGYIVAVSWIGPKPMTEAHRNFLRSVMAVAWSKYRYERGAVTFAAALRHAWTWHKGAADREAQAERYRSAPAHRTIEYRQPVQSPIRRSLTGKAYAFTLSREAGRVTSRLGA